MKTKIKNLIKEYRDAAKHEESMIGFGLGGPQAWSAARARADVYLQMALKLEKILE